MPLNFAIVFTTCYIVTLCRSFDLDNVSGESKGPARSNDERFEAMVRKALILPICTGSLLAAGQFASAQTLQPSSPCPPGTVAQNYNRGTESGSQTAQNYNRGTESGAQTAQNYNRGTAAPVVGRVADVSADCK
jgi:hypothetical protein